MHRTLTQDIHHKISDSDLLFAASVDCRAVYLFVANLLLLSTTSAGSITRAAFCRWLKGILWLKRSGICIMASPALSRGLVRVLSLAYAACFRVLASECVGIEHVASIRYQHIHITTMKNEVEISVNTLSALGICQDGVESALARRTLYVHQGEKKFGNWRWTGNHTGSRR
jgi:hypothetical protein